VRYSRETGFGLLGVAALCFLLSAPPWMFLLTGIAAIGFGYLGLRQGRADDADDIDADRDDLSDDGVDGAP
jgi:hypothetical protein